MTSFDRITRRTALAGAASLALVGPARAQAQKVIIGTWGGDYAKLLTKNIETPLLTPKGIEVVQDQAADSPHRTKLLAEKRLPRGTTDV
jgi:putative spermidine/putrescine transport system substrate-binding protein